MKRCHASLMISAVFLGAMIASNAHAGGDGHFQGHGGGHWGGPAGGGPFIAPLDPRMLFGAMLLAPLLYPPPPAYYYSPAPAAVPEPAYIQTYPSQALPPESGYWYHRYWRFYCASSNAYYPSVQLCPEGWQQVAPRPPY